MNLIKTFFFLCCFSFLSFAQGLASEEESFHYIESHLESLTLWSAQKNSNDPYTLINDIQRTEFYGSSLAGFFHESFSDQTLQPYAINLIPLYFQVVTGLHDHIQNLPAGNKESKLKAIGLISLKKIHDLFFEPALLRRLMADQLKAHQDLGQSWEELLNLSFQPVRLEKLTKALRDYGVSDHREFEAVWSQSDALIMVTSEKGLAPLNQLGSFQNDFSDALNSILGTLANGASSAFGTVAGNIAWREGYLKDNQGLLAKLEAELLPFDLLMEKKAYKLTDKTIPGHWGHVGVYLGSKEQLIALGLWSHPSIEPFKKSIEEGKRIFQVRRWGLVFDTLEDFINLDEMAVLRVDGFSQKSTESLGRTLTYLSEQLDKSYDFSFDAMTGETITCTEIIAFSYGDIAWPTQELLGRLTISPNDLAQLSFYQDSPLQPLLYITGDEAGLHERSLDELAYTLGFKKIGSSYQQHESVCQREHYRHRRDGLRFRYFCEDVFTPRTYSGNNR